MCAIVLVVRSATEACPQCKVCNSPYSAILKRIFQLGLVDQDLQTGYSSVVYMPGPNSEERECWYIDMGTVDNAFFTPGKLQNAGH